MFLCKCGTYQLRKTAWLGLGQGFTKHSPQILTEQRNPPSWHWLGAHKLNSMCKIPSQGFLEAAAALVTAGPPLWPTLPFFSFLFPVFPNKSWVGKEYDQLLWKRGELYGCLLAMGWKESLFEDHPKNTGSAFNSSSNSLRESNSSLPWNGPCREE